MHGGDVYSNKIELDFSININPYPLSDDFINEITASISGFDKYPEPENKSLINALSKMEDVNPEWMVCGNGASEILMAIFNALNPDNVYIYRPSFTGYDYVIRNHGLYTSEYIGNNKTGFIVDENFVEWFENEIRNSVTNKNSLLILASPNNPTGKAIRIDILSRLLNLCEDNDIFMLLDGCFSSLSQNEEGIQLSKLYTNLVKRYKKLILINALTKSYRVPGVRIGYAMCRDEDIIINIKNALPEWNVSTIAQTIGIAAVKEDNYLQESIKYILEQKNILIDRLRKLQFKVYDSDVSFVLVEGPKDLYERLLKRNILIRKCNDFKGLEDNENKEKDIHFYRIAVKSESENEKLIKIISEEYK